MQSPSLFLLLIVLTTLLKTTTATAQTTTVVQLNDSNFEHDTQSSTGSTTGNWLVLFYSPSDAPAYMRPKESDKALTQTREVFKALANNVELTEAGIVIAEIDVIKSPRTAKRFNYTSPPSSGPSQRSFATASSSVYFLVQGHYYVYYPTQTPLLQSSVESFVLESYASTPKTKIQTRSGISDYLTYYLVEHPEIKTGLTRGFVVFLLIGGYYTGVLRKKDCKERAEKAKEKIEQGKEEKKGKQE